MKELTLRCSPVMRKMRQQWWAPFAAILLLATPLLFSFLGGWGFLDPDEGRYGTIPYQMLTRADFITPTQNEIKFFDKPPLLYWLIAASYTAFGANEWAARLVPALAALLGVLSAYALGQRMFGVRAGILGAVILATSLMWLVMGRFVVTDMLVSSLVFLALALWWFGHTEKNSIQRHRQTAYFLGFWATLGFAVLAKGPIAVVLAGGCIFSYMLLCRQWHSLVKMRWDFGIPLCLAIAAPWFVLVAQRNPEFNHFFWYDQHIGRFLGKTTSNGHVHGPAYFLQFLPVIFFPWSFFVPAALVACWRERHAFRFQNAQLPSLRVQGLIYLICGVLFTLLFFSISSGKLLTYILPVLPLLALLLAAYFDRLFEKGVPRDNMLTMGVGLLGFLLLLIGIVVVVIIPARLYLPESESSAAVALGASVIMWSLLLILSSWRFRLGGLIASTAGGFTLTAVAALMALTAVLPNFTTKALAGYIQPGLASHPSAEVLTIGYVRSIPFYTRHRVEILGAPGELDYGVQHMPADERRLWVFEDAAKMANLRQEMNDPYPVYCFIEKSKGKQNRAYELMREIGNGAAPIIANEGFLVFGNRAALAATPPVMTFRTALLHR